MQEEELGGGNTTPGVARLGDTVRRPRDGRSTFAATALRALERLGFAEAPRYRGVDEQGRDVLTFVPGRTTDHPSQRDERCYAEVGRILRRLHDLTRGTGIAAGGICLVHGDAAPFNTILRAGMPVALIDWDGAHAGDPMEDVGYAGWTWCIQTEGNVPIGEQADRLRRFRDGYDGDLPAEALLAAVAASQRSIVDLESAIAGDPGAGEQRRAHARRAVAWARADHELLAAHRDRFLAALMSGSDRATPRG